MTGEKRERGGEGRGTERYGGEEEWRKRGG